MTIAELPEDARIDELLSVVLRLAAGDLHARVELTGTGDPTDLLATGLNMLAEELASALDQQQSAREDLEAEVQKRTASLTQEIAERKRAEQLIQHQTQAIRELSTPVIEVWDGVLVIPLIGIIDEARGKQLTTNLMEAIAARQASVAIIDLTGVPVADTTAADQLVDTVRVAEILGTKVILTGLGPGKALSFAKSGIDLSHVTTRGTLQAGLSDALLLTGRQVVETR